MKKALKITGIVIGVIFLLLLILPFAFKGKITQIVKKELNKSINATVDFESVNLSLIRSFPNASIKIKNLKVVGIDEFKEDTLANIQSTFLTVDLMSIFRGSEIGVKRVNLDYPNILLKVLKDGKANWDIAKASTDTTTKQPEEPSAFKVKMDKITINHAHIVYDDASLATVFSAKDLNATLKGDLTLDVTTLDANIESKAMSLDYGGVRYLNEAVCNIKTTFIADLANWKFTFKNADLLLNALNLTADGWLALIDEGFDMDLKFGAKENTFKAFLSLIPAIYAKDFNNIKTDGTLAFSGFVKGKYTDFVIPAFSVDLKVGNGMFKYPDLPSDVRNININLSAKNPDGIPDHTVVDIQKFHAEIAGSPIDAALLLKTPVSDPDINGWLKGKLDLQTISKIYPLGEKTTLTGLVNADVTMAGRMSSIEKGQYEQFKAAGFALMENINYSSPDLAQPVSIKNARLDFSPAALALSNFAMTMGKSDLSMQGKIESYLPYFLKKEGVLKGSLSVNSNLLDLNSLMGTSTTPATSDTSSAMAVVQIPANMDLSLTANVAKLLYDNYNLSNVAGNLQVKDEALWLNNLSANMLGGSVALKGMYTAINPKKPQVDLDVNLKNIAVKEAFKTFNTMQKLVPVAEKMTGDFSTNLKFKGDLTENMMPVLESITGNGLITSTSLGLENVALMGKIADALKMDNLRKIALKELNMNFELLNGKVFVKPTDFNLGTFKSNISGSTGLDKSINYLLTTNIPRSMFGGQANNVLNNLLGEASKKGVNVNLGELIPVSVIITGTLTDPQIKVALKDLANSLVGDVKEQLKQELEAKKEEVINTAKTEANKLIEAADARAAQLIADAEKQRDQMMNAARDQASKLRAQSDTLISKQVAEAKKKGAIAELAAKKAGDVARKETDKKAQTVLDEAQKQSDNIVARARAEADKIKQDARNQVEKR